MISVFGSKVGKEEIENVNECMRTQWMGFGKIVNKFEQEFSKKFQLNNFLMVDSGSNALFMAVKLLNLPAGSEVILPSYTWVSCAQSIVMADLKPVFCDVDLNTMNVRVSDIQRSITKKTSAIMVVDYAGLPAKIDEISQLGYPIIEDAAHAVFSRYKGLACGSLADIAIYSFDAVKNLTVGEGGGITTKDEKLIKRASKLRYCGIGKSGFDSATTLDKNQSRWWEYNIEETFIKMLPTNIAGSIGLAQLKKIDMLQSRRKEIWDIYQNEFKHVNWIENPVDAEDGDRHSYFTYCIKVPERDRLANYLLKNGIYTTLRYHPLHLNPIFKSTNLYLKNSEALNKRGLNIPLHPRLTDADVDKVIQKIKAFNI